MIHINNMSAVSDDGLDVLWDYFLEVGLTSESKSKYFANQRRYLYGLL